MLRRFAAWATLLLSTAAFAQERLPDLPQGGESLVDVGHGSVSRGVTGLAAAVDDFFSNDPHEAKINESRLRLGTGMRIAEYDGIDPLLRVRLDLQLPRLERRVNLVISSSGTDDLSEADDVGVFDDRGAAGFLRFFLFEDDPTLLTFDGGLRFRPEVDPFVRSRIQREFVWGDNLIRPTQFVFWERLEGFGAQSWLDYDRTLNDRTLLRLRGEAELTQESDGVEFQPALYLYRRIDRRTWLRLKLGIEADTDPPHVIEETVVGVRCRRNLWREWLFLEIEPRLRFEEERDRRMSPGIDLRVEAIVGGIYGR
jgi:hypothetical protein